MKKEKKGEAVVDEAKCLGCGYCEYFCPKGCIEVSGDRFTAKGYLLPVFAHPENCVACGICAWMCPPGAIEVYEYVEAE